MSIKLSRLKKWLTLEESAKSLSLLINEQITATDLFHYAVERKLTLSINLVFPCRAIIGKKVPIESATLHQFPLQNLNTATRAGAMEGPLRMVHLDTLNSGMLRKHLASLEIPSDGERDLVAKLIKDKINSPQADYAVCFEGHVMSDYSGVLEFDHSVIQTVNGVWDLPMEGSEYLAIKEIFYAEMTGVNRELIKLGGILQKLSGTFLKHPYANRWLNLYDRVDNETFSLDIRNFRLRDGIPEQECLVIRPDELQRFAETLSEPESSDSTNTERQEYPPLLEALPDDFLALYNDMGAGELPHMDTLITAWRKFWKGRVPNDGKPYPVNADVADWVKKQMESPSTVLAENMAKIIRPSWAPTGRQSNRNQ